MDIFILVPLSFGSLMHDKSYPAAFPGTNLLLGMTSVPVEACFSLRVSYHDEPWSARKFGDNIRCSFSTDTL